MADREVDEHAKGGLHVEDGSLAQAGLLAESVRLNPAGKHVRAYRRRADGVVSLEDGEGGSPACRAPVRPVPRG